MKVFLLGITGCCITKLTPPSGGFHKYLIMTKNSNLPKDDLKWIKFNQKMAAMSGKKKLKKQDFFDARCSLQGSFFLYHVLCLN